MNTLKLPCETGEISDGYHTFNELYEHRILLFLALMKSSPQNAWFSMQHEDGSRFDGWFIAGFELPAGTITYHLPTDKWQLAADTGATAMDKAPKWDGHSSLEVVSRLIQFIKK